MSALLTVGMRNEEFLTGSREKGAESASSVPFSPILREVNSCQTAVFSFEWCS